MKKIKQNRAASFVIVTLVYLLATAIGILTYRALPLSWWLSLLIADAAATVTTFLFSLVFGNASQNLEYDGERCFPRMSQDDRD